MLLAANALEGAYAPSGTAGTLPVNWDHVTSSIESTTEAMKTLFLSK